MASILFQPAIEISLPYAGDAEYAYPLIEIEFNYIPGKTLSYSSPYENEEDKIEFVSCKVLKEDYVGEYLREPAKWRGCDWYGDVDMAEFLCREWLDTDGFDTAVETGRND